jgi:hypothetical protein
LPRTAAGRSPLSQRLPQHWAACFRFPNCSPLFTPRWR